MGTRQGISLAVDASLRWIGSPSIQEELGTGSAALVLLHVPAIYWIHHVPPGMTIIDMEVEDDARIPWM